MKSSRLIPCFAIAWMLGAQIPPPVSGTAHTDVPVLDPMKSQPWAVFAQRRNSLRQQQIIDDTARLVQLSQELKAEVDRSTKDELSLSVVKKAEEIEKLAKAVKILMRDGY